MKRKEIHQYDLEGNYIKSYESISKCSKETNISTSLIISSATHKRMTNNFMFRYIKKDKIESHNKSVFLFNSNGELIKEYKSLEELSKTLDTSEHSLGFKLRAKNKNKFVKIKNYFVSYTKSKKIISILI